MARQRARALRTRAATPTATIRVGITASSAPPVAVGCEVETAPMPPRSGDLVLFADDALETRAWRFARCGRRLLLRDPDGGAPLPIARAVVLGVVVRVIAWRRAATVAVSG